MPLDERTLRYLASLGITGAPAPAAPQGLASTLQQLGGVGGRRLPNPVTDRQTIVAGGAPQQTINVNTGTTAPSGAARPSTTDESALASQAGWAGANEAVAPYLGDWRATPAQILAAAVGGYQRSRYAAQQDIAAQRQQQQLFDLKKQQMEAEQAGAQAQADQRTAIMAEIRKLPPGEQTIALLDPEGWAKAKAGQMFPEPAKPMQVGNDLVDPMTGRLVYRAPFAPRDPAQAPETWQTLSPDETRAMGYPEGVVVQRSSRGQLNTSFKPTNQSAGITFETPDGGTLSIGGSSGGQAVKLPQGFYMGDPSPEAQAAGITSKVAAPLPGTPEYAKATESINASTVFRAKLDQMRQLYDEVGTQVMPGEAKGRLESLANDLKLSYALAKGQGALQKTDEQVISSVLGAVTSPMSLLPGGADQVKAQIGQAIQSVDRDISGLVTQYPWARIHGASQNVPSPEVQGQTIMNKSGAREPASAVDNGPPSPAAQPPAQKRDPAAFIRDHW